MKHQTIAPSPAPGFFARGFQFRVTLSFLSGISLALAAFGSVRSARGAAGDLDPAFGNQGMALSDFGGSNDFAYGTTLQTDRKIIVVGFRYTGDSFEGGDFLVARYNADGTLDKTFGHGGKVITDFGMTDAATAARVQPDGKIVVAGITYPIFSFTRNFALSRYNPDGSLDASFGNGGLVTSFFGDQGCSISLIALQPDGKIIAAGAQFVNFTDDSNSNTDFAIARYNANGTLDSTFGHGGLVTTDFFKMNDSAAAVLLQPDGKIVAVGTSEGSFTYYDFAVVRYLPNGALDKSFGQKGKVYTDLGTEDGEGADAALLQPDGKIVAGAAPAVTPRRMARILHAHSLPHQRANGQKLRPKRRGGN